MILCISYGEFVTMRPRRNCHYFADNIFECIFFSLKISQKFFPGARINNIPALVQIIAWHRPVCAFIVAINQNCYYDNTSMMPAPHPPPSPPPPSLLPYLGPTYLYNGNPCNWKHGLYIGTRPKTYNASHGNTLAMVSPFPSQNSVLSK